MLGLYPCVLWAAYWKRPTIHWKKSHLAPKNDKNLPYLLSLVRGAESVEELTDLITTYLP
jgi:hypothetical protein